MSHNNQKKIAVINDLCGFGRCSVSVSLPVISALKIQCCPVPTVIFSNHTGFDSFYYADFTSHLEAYIAQWEKLDLRFDGILTGAAYSQHMPEEELARICRDLAAMGPGRIVISGLELGEELGNFVYERGRPPQMITERRAGPYRSGTGDVYASIIAADAVNGVDFTDSVRHASAFVAKCIRRTEEMGIPRTDGICFEEYLKEL